MDYRPLKLSEARLRIPVGPATGKQFELALKQDHSSKS